MTTGKFYSLVSLHCRLAMHIRFLIFGYHCGDAVFFCYHVFSLPLLHIKMEKLIIAVAIDLIVQI